MKNYIYKILMTLFCVALISVKTFAEIADAPYLKWIRQVEQLVPNLSRASELQKQADIAIIKNNLAKLRAGTKSKYRLDRINKAEIRFNEFMEAETRNRSVPIQPRARKVEFKDEPHIITIPARAPKGMSITQRLKTLLLYTKSLVSTADVAIIVKQKDNAQSSLAQAAHTVDIMHKILRENPRLMERYSARVQALHNRVAKTLEEVRLMQ